MAMFTKTMFRLIVFFTLLSLILAACGPSQSELDATATNAFAQTSVAQTAAAPTKTPSPTPSQTPAPTTTSTSTPMPTATMTSTPTLPTKGVVKGRAYWQGSDTPVVGASIMLDNDHKTETDEQGYFAFEDLVPGSYWPAVMWGPEVASDLPCDSPEFTLGDEWFTMTLKMNDGSYSIISQHTSDLPVAAGEVIQLDILFICK
jgi:hypothetical protein